MPSLDRRWAAAVLSWGAAGAGCLNLACERPERAAPRAVGWEVSSDAAPTEPRFEDQDFVLEVGPPSRCERSDALAPPAGWTRLTVPISVEATTTRTVPLSPLSFHLEDAEGHRYFSTFAGCEEAFQPTQLRAGKKLEASVSFDVPQAAGRYELTFEPFLIGRKPVLARARVPRLSARE